MSNNTRNTLTTRVGALEGEVAAISTEIGALRGDVQAVLAALTGEAPAKPTTTRKAAPKARKASSRKAPARKAPAKAQPKADRMLCKATRAAFVAAAAEAGVDFAKCSTKAIAAMCLEDERLIPAGFGIGEGYRALLG